MKNETIEMSEDNANPLPGATSLDAKDKTDSPVQAQTIISTQNPNIAVGNKEMNEQVCIEASTPNLESLIELSPTGPLMRTNFWAYKPVPNNQPEPHSEDFSKSAVCPDGYKLIGARARGKTHKHEGTNCDDWFEFGFSGKWTVIAVADGAGSKPYSRIGAKAACKKAVAYLLETLKETQIEEYLKGSTYGEIKLLIDKQAWPFENITKMIFNAFSEAHKEVHRIANEKTLDPGYLSHLGGRKELSVNDFSSTLLVAIHANIKCLNEPTDIVFSCNVGDGAIAILDKNGSLNLATIADSGEYSGETDFLTSTDKILEKNLRLKLKVNALKLRSLMVMTDGVADDYYPNDPELKYLCADLMLNRIIKLNIPEQDIVSFINSNKPRTSNDLFAADALEKVMRLTANPYEVTYRTISSYSRALGITIEELVNSPQLLMCAHCSKNQPLSGNNTDASEMLKEWLDSYYVRGSFDDRTLVILHDEELT